MIARTAIFFYAMMVTMAFAQQGNYVYDDHGKKDPFSPLVSPTGVLVDDEEGMGISDLNLEGIVSDASGSNLAIMNGKVVKAGDHIGPYLVNVIAEDSVRLLKDNQEFVLNLKKGG